MNLVEVLGTFSSVVVAVSLTMRNLRALRLVNLVGAGFFSVYGYLIGSLPVLGLNAFIVAINVYYLARMAQARDAFAVLDVGSAGNAEGRLLARFLEHHRADILRFQPDWTDEALQGNRVVFLLREVLPVSLFVCRAEGDAQRVLLDYTIPSWRDYRNARFFFDMGWRELAWGDARRFVVESEVAAHRKYLRKVGFEERVENGSTLFVKDLAPSQ